MSLASWRAGNKYRVWSSETLNGNSFGGGGNKFDSGRKWRTWFGLLSMIDFKLAWKSLEKQIREASYNVRASSRLGGAGDHSVSKGSSSGINRWLSQVSDGLPGSYTKTRKLAGMSLPLNQKKFDSCLKRSSLSVSFRYRVCSPARTTIWVFRASSCGCSPLSFDMRVLKCEAANKDDSD